MNPYVDPATGTLYNKLGIHDRYDLKIAEYDITARRVIELRLNPIQGRFDLEHLRAIHHHIFQDVFEWAGQLRTINFSKRDIANPAYATAFADLATIPTLAQALAKSVRDQGFLRNMPPFDFTASMASLYIGWNHMHPFPEGNGRATQTFLAQLAREAGYSLDFKRIASTEWNKAAASSLVRYHVDNPSSTRPATIEPLLRAFAKIIQPLERAQTRATPEKGLDR